MGLMLMGNISRREALGGSAAAVAIALSTGSAAQQPSGPKPNQRKVAFIVDEGANMIDLAGAWEVFQDTRIDKERQKEKAFYLYAVAPERKLYHTTGNGPGSGLPFMPNYTVADAPAPNVIVMGAQGGNPDNPPKIDWIRRHAEGADVIMSVCTGAFLLASTGLLDGKRATTHHEYFDSFAEAFPKVELIRDARFVDNGKFVSGGGLTSGVDSALHVVSRLIGPDHAAATARYMEYEGTGWKTAARAS